MKSLINNKVLRVKTLVAMPELSAKVEALIVAFLFLVFGIALGGTVVTTVQGVNTDAWVFTGHEGVESMIDLFPLIYYAAIILGFLGLCWYAITRSNVG